MKSNHTQHDNRDAFTAPRAGSLLIANPMLLDRSFNRAVIFILSISSQNAHCGLNISKPTNFTLADLDLDTELPDNLPIYFGGPVGTDRLFMLHDIPDLLTHSMHIANNIYISSDLKQLQKIAPLVDDLSRHVRFFIGYAGWNPNQLDDEINSGAWVVSPTPSAKLMFRTPAEELWTREVTRLGEEYQCWTLIPSLRELN